MLDGLPLERYQFIGITEYFNDDLASLAQCFGWSVVTAPGRRNVSANFVMDIPAPTQEDREEIAALNQEDAALYQAALELRRQRRCNAS